MIRASLSSLPRRRLLRAGASLVAASGLATLAPVALAQPRAARLRIGFQKSAALLTLQKARGTLDKRLAAAGATLEWVEFPAGPQLLEGLNVGAVDVGFVGEAPPVFAQAAGAKFVYIGHDAPAPAAEAIVVPKDSPLRGVTDLAGRTIALNKGSNVHYLLVRALERHGLKYADVRPVFLPPADARAAFERGAVDAWAIWDPFLAAVEHGSGARILADGQGLVDNHAFYLAERGFAERHPALVQALFDDTQAEGRWARANARQAAAIIAPAQGLPVEVVERALARYPFGVRPMSTEAAVAQQKVADAFHALKLIPKPVRIADALPGATLAAQLR